MFCWIKGQRIRVTRETADDDRLIDVTILEGHNDLHADSWEHLHAKARAGDLLFHSNPVEAVFIIRSIFIPILVLNPLIHFIFGFL